ncbi:TPA: hypothetical protein QDC20_007749 [Burkholderia aenigmatica]|nr:MULTISPECIES: hypothetical protein [Burkholderia]MDN7516519.1 hypothetical protein [Burkholderia sp. AU45251]HDR9483456.1 hypothetical protein [Burkholderia aenigmatica]HDR9514405.1 hypothetical protein [Burkholderia aenigmatica]HDR9520393.1 hypothetical protein [Burkholderia aenigmatica]HDR9591795.1 hypothetical protein [Burkholderia aenigmatica]
MKLARTELFGMGIALGLLAIPAWMLLEGMLIPLAPLAEWPKNVALAGLGMPIVAGGTFLYRKTDARSLMWLLLGWLLIASIGGMILALLTFVVGVPLG